MTSPDREGATRLLKALSTPGGLAEPDAERLWAIVYEKLRRLAGVVFQSERGDHTLEPTALANEAYLKLIRQDQVSWQDEAHFLAIAAQAMRRVLVDHERARRSLKRGAEWERVELQSRLLARDGAERLDVTAVHAALEKLEGISEKRARIAELRFFGGLSMEAVAEVLDTPLGTAKREWRFARAWLARELKRAEEG